LLTPLPQKIIHLPQHLKETVSLETTERKESLRFNAFLLAGIIGFGCAVVLGIVSLPSVSKSLSWQEFRLIQVNRGFQHEFAQGP
jgi:hypothetical protein